MKHTKKQQRKKELFRDYWNNFITVGAFAAYYGLSDTAARTIIEIGRTLHNEEAEFLKESKK